MAGLSVLQLTTIYGSSVAMNIEDSHYLMKCTFLICLFTLVLCGHSLAQAAPASAHAASCSPALLDIDGNKIWMNEEGKGNITVVFEAGFGNDSSVWSQITPKIQAAGVQTFVYDRAGMGRSTIDASTPYSIDNDVHILRSALANCNIKGPIVMVGHSYGGAISLLAASEDPDIAGLVLIEAVVPNVWTATEVENNLKMMRPQYDEIRERPLTWPRWLFPSLKLCPTPRKK
jgi:pimeloyl-ACP methyl ester carboxylesterase